MIIAKARKGLSLLTEKTHPNPIFILGNQKSGTSAIAALLAEATSSTATIDLRREITAPTFHLVKQGKLPLSVLIYLNKFDFQSEIIKEPNLSLLYESLTKRFPYSKYVLVVRDPRDNIRSILNRLKIPGNLDYLSQDYSSNLTKAWELVINLKWMGIKEEHYVEQLAQRWNYIVEGYLSHQEDIILLRYEDFLLNKSTIIKELAAQLGLTPSQDISKSVDVQFQPRGDRTITWVDFFGKLNLGRIENLCGNNMTQLHYPLNKDLTQKGLL